MPQPEPHPPDEIPPGQELPAGTLLEEFVIERVLGSGGFGITYLAGDSRLGRKVVIKENLPSQFAFRDLSSLAIRPRSSRGEDAESFAWSLENFGKEAAMLASLDHPGIVRVHRSFEALGTAYFVMPFVEGASLEEEGAKRRGRGRAFDEDEVRGLLWWLLEALEHLHVRGIYHRDIKPGNILITDGGDPVLIDFGAARQRLGERSLTVIESPGYTPFEQLQSRGRIGPWSDLYALGATLCKVLTGEAPPKATDRAFDDPFEPLAGRVELKGRYSEELLSSVDRALGVRVEDRWQRASDWRFVAGGGVNQKGSDAMEIERRAGELAEKLAADRLEVMVETSSMPGVGYVTEEKSSDGLEAAGPPRFLMSGERAGETRTLGGIEMVWCPPGEFLMGSPESEKGRSRDEAQHSVILTQGFWLAKFECTQAHWQRAMGSNPSHFKGSALPVEQVSWKDVRSWFAKMNELHPLPDRWIWELPTEAQWEYACRAGATGVYGGTGDLYGMGWYAGNSGRKSHCVGAKAPNAWGFHDMHGNVWEWCRDWYGAYPSERVADPSGFGLGTCRVFRGGSWGSIAIYCRSADRYRISPDFRLNDVGFRPAAVPADQ